MTNFAIQTMTLSHANYNTFQCKLWHFPMQTMALSDTNYGTLYNLTKRTARNAIVLGKTFGGFENYY